MKGLRERYEEGSHELNDDYQDIKAKNMEEYTNESLGELSESKKKTKISKLDSLVNYLDANVLCSTSIG